MWGSAAAITIIITDTREPQTRQMAKEHLFFLITTPTHRPDCASFGLSVSVGTFTCARVIRKTLALDGR